MKHKIILVILMLSTSIYANFNFGECQGSGTFEQQIVHYAGDYENTTTVGSIPQGIKGLHVELTSDTDVDIRLYGENDDKIVHWPYGIHNQSIEKTKPYHDVNITYSGYNGVDGEKGHEFIEVNGTTPTTMTMKAFGYKAGYATVNYSWTGKEGCTANESGTGSFTQTLVKDTTSLVGSIPPNVENVQINLNSDKDLDIQLYGADGTAIASWKPMGLMAGPIKQSTMYHGMNITWSGYNGTDGQAGHEYITVTPKTTEVLVMKVFGYEAGEAEVDYSWGDANTTDDYNVILAYTEDASNPAPTVQNYLHIGLSTATINPNTLAEVNEAITSSASEEIDTFEELLHVLSGTSACLSKEELLTIIDSYDQNYTIANTECITDMSHFFDDKVVLYELSKWNVSHVTDMSHMFEKARIGIDLHIENWDISNVTDISHMFEWSLYTIPSINEWDVSNVTDMSYMFYVTVNFNQDIGNWNVSNVNNMSHMFYATNKFNQDIGDWNVSNVTDMSFMFYGYNVDGDQPGGTTFNQDIGGWDVSNVTDMSDMFTYARSFSGHDLTTWNVNNVTKHTGFLHQAGQGNTEPNWND